MSDKAFLLARRRILNNAKRREQRSLDLKNKGLLNLPQEIGQLTSLTELDLSQNKLVSLPVEIGKMESLERLVLEDNNLNSLPPEIGQLQNLRELNLSWNQFKILPKQVFELKALQVLELSNNQLSMLDPGIAQLSNLDALWIDSNAVRFLPPELGRLTNLTVLDVSGNGLTSLPSELGQLKEMMLLGLDSNEFDEVPELIFSFGKLRHLYLSYNSLTVLPAEIERFAELQTLAIESNKLSSIPTAIGNLRQIRSLKVSNNNLRELPVEIGNALSLADAAQRPNAPAYWGLHIEGNPLPLPYPTLIADGQPRATTNVLAWLRGEIDPSTLKTDAASAESELQELNEKEIEGALEQRPASFRFGLRGGKIDVLPEQPAIIDVDVAADLHTELLSKARILEARLTQTNSDPRVRSSAARLLSELDKSLSQIRPGILLSRSRSIEADRNAFDTEEARRELFPDAIALMDDVLLSLQDLMAIFPIVREIEAERVALALQGDITTLDSITTNIDTIKTIARDSEIVTPAAAQALKENDTEIRDARGIAIQARLIADQLLVVRNFTGGAALFARQALMAGTKRIASELGELGSKSWDEVKTNLPPGIGAASRALPLVALIGLLALISPPVAGIAGAAAAFRPLSRALKKIIGSAEKEASKDSGTPKKRKPKKAKDY
jgi:Leucine-rich repeat (LRR) protein